VPELADFWFRNLSAKKLRLQPLHTKVMEPFMRLRNDFHHGRLKTGVGERAAEGLEWLNRLLEAVRFLSEYQLSFAQRILLDKDSERKMCHIHELTLFNGCFSSFDRRRWQSDIHLEPKSVIFLHPGDKRHLVLEPFVIFTDQVRGVPDVFLLNNVAKGTPTYVSSQFGEAVVTTNEGWTDGERYREALGGFFDLMRLSDSSEEEAEIEEEPLPEDDSLFPTAEVFQRRYRDSDRVVEHKSPYKFLDYYNPEDRDIFFGRDKEIRILQQKFYNSRLLVLHGESGTGKTSLIRAGLIPALSPEIYVPAYVRVLREPLREIKRDLIRQLNLDERHLELSLAEFLMKETERLSRTVVIVLDQFEEFFLRFPEEVRQEFERELGACVEVAHLDVKFLISLRADYFSYLASFESSVPRIFTHQVQLAPLTEAQASEAIVRPPEQLGMTVDENMVREKLLPDLLSPEGVEAPLLQIVCDALYQNAQSEGRAEIDMEDYEAIGDVRGALGDYLDTRLRQFGKGQHKARAVLKSLVTAEGTKRASFAEELVSRISSAGLEMGEEELRRDYLDRFVRDRLVRVEDAEGEARYDLSHEYLVRHIGAWIEESEREVTKVLEVIDRAYEAYHSTGLLLEVSALEMITPFREQLILTPEKQGFVDRSKRQVRKKRRGLLLKVGFLLMFVAVLVGGIFGYQTYRAYQEAVRQKVRAEANALEAEQKGKNSRF